MSKIDILSLFIKPYNHQEASPLNKSHSFISKIIFYWNFALKNTGLTFTFIKRFILSIYSFCRAKRIKNPLHELTRSVADECCFFY